MRVYLKRWDKDEVAAVEWYPRQRLVYNNYMNVLNMILGRVIDKDFG